MLEFIKKGKRIGLEINEYWKKRGNNINRKIKIRKHIFEKIGNGIIISKDRDEKKTTKHKQSLLYQQDVKK